MVQSDSKVTKPRSIINTSTVMEMINYFLIVILRGTGELGHMLKVSLNVYI
jgi:hypothetical protein